MLSNDLLAELLVLGMLGEASERDLLGDME
jgi:hypothetical protein